MNGSYVVYGAPESGSVPIEATLSLPSGELMTESAATGPARYIPFVAGWER